MPARTTTLLRSTTTTTVLHMGKGFKNKKNKQFLLQQQMEQLQQAKEQEEGVTLSDDEIKKRNDKKRFEELLRDNMRDGDALTDYLTEEQELEESDAQRKYAGMNINKVRKDRLFTDDPFPSVEETFYNLISTKTDNKPIGKYGTEQLIPWIKRGTNQENYDTKEDYTIIITDPRNKSINLRETITSLNNQLSKKILSKIIFVNADTSFENNRFMKKNDLLGKVNILSDVTEKENESGGGGSMEFMKSYTALGDKSFTICMFIITPNGRISKLVRDLDSVLASEIINKAITVL